MNTKKIKIILAILKIPAILIFIVAVISFYSIYSSVKEKCESAVQEFGEDCVGSLAEVVKSADHTYVEKNGAVWAIGQIADKKALPFLHELAETASYKDCNLSQNICGFEVQKAIKWCTKGNVTSWMYTSLTK